MAVQSALYDEISAMLVESDLFNHLPSAELRTAAHYFSITNLAADEVIFHEGEIGNFMCIVHEGSVYVIKTNQNEEQINVVKLGNGRAFGEMAVLDGERRSATCKAAEESVVLTLSKDALDKMLAEHPLMAARIIRAIAVSLSRRLRMAVGQLVDYID
ncbi:MAG: cyclic nucleotide-binding domain-containing protein [Gammaproteobacteria bacterium]|nr:cyclic nucleotide-binding domain-containing protein [Gammaproteobacteria bacterium]MBU1623470.1 cyclic nucleotide-binding domain-containing protein [Gammaproteobacteria bacterium]MBU1982309.1 cyclic nucleotide-binding domain-containing protein [Gammaproteobacteria bacterium]